MKSASRVLACCFLSDRTGWQRVLLDFRVRRILNRILSQNGVAKEPGVADSLVRSADGLILHALHENFTAAESLYRAALQIDPKHVPALCNRE